MLTVTDMNLYQRLLALTEEAITTLRTIQETQTESQRNAMASRAANDSIKAFCDSQRGAGDELPRLRRDLAKAGNVICGLREQDARIAELLGAEPDADLVKAVEDLCKKAEGDGATAYNGGRRALAAAAKMLREQAETVQPVGFSSLSTAAVLCWAAYLIDTSDEVPLTLREWLNGRKS